MEELQEKFLELLDDGGSIVVRCDDDEIVIESEEPSLLEQLREEQTELFGYLGSVNQRISMASGCALQFGLLLLAIGACVCLQTFVPAVRGSWWWVYPLCFVGAMFLWVQLSAWRETVVYFQQKPELESRLAAAGISRYRLVGIILGEGYFDKLAFHMRCDQAASRINP